MIIHSFVFLSTFIEEFQHADIVQMLTYLSPHSKAGFSGSSQNFNFFCASAKRNILLEQIKDYRIRFLNSQHAHGAPTISYSYFDK